MLKKSTDLHHSRKPHTTVGVSKGKPATVQLVAVHGIVIRMKTNAATESSYIVLSEGGELGFCALF